ncbi:hypothetical protein [Paractinoplanes atraurantiacus]|uniref:Uncharacterized protein n=1 Tax=Paractinoplanes atraurantiacus TaxID=1036182 RepID=A0A285HIJ3_9ACTN|nr:hypothetical protein [Actinoplanes atraurantiacus]SNY35559.1 hypothetical protein SAMN05421748_104454 [Actinoplanes atraurantiacus]
MDGQQPGDTTPAAGMPEPTRVEDGAEHSTVDAPARWSGAAAVVPPEPKKRWWQRETEPEDDRLATPAVDPWADYDTPLDPFPAVPETPLPPTRVEPPQPTKVEAPQPPAFTSRPPVAAPPTPAPAPAPAPVSPRPVTGPPVPLPSKPAKQRRRDRKAAKRQPVAPRPPTGPPTGGPLPAPPPWAPRQPARPLPTPPRRKSRWGRRLALFSLLSVACCCGIPFGAYQLSSAQYPVTAVLPESFADLQLRDTQDSGSGSFAGEYKDDRGKRVTVFGMTGFRLTPGSDVGAHLEQVADEYKLSDVQSFDLGEFGAHESCGVGRDDGSTVVVCAWADHGSLATVLLTRRSVQDSADLVARLREAVLTKP